MTSISPQASIAAQIDLNSYDKFVVAFSGGKDSTAALLHLLKVGVPKHKIELWHHDIDGREGSTLMDWACTRSYCQAFSTSFGLPIYFSWREGGFEREMLRKDSLTGSVFFETPDGLQNKPSQDREQYKNTRLKFPQVSADLSIRWCSSYLKIDVLSTAIRNQTRFDGIKTCVVTGERGEESAARAKYKVFEPHRADLRDGLKVQRHIDHYRPILEWTEKLVWETIELFKVHAHPAYYLGFSRVSCLFCIFGNANQFASAKFVDPLRFSKLPAYEKMFGLTVKRKTDLDTLAASGSVYREMNEHYLNLSRSENYNDEIILADWHLPKGAYSKDGCGPK